MALERVMKIHGTPLQAASLRGGLAATAASASGEASRDKTQNQVEGFRSLIEQAAKRYNLDGALLAAVVHVESGGNPKAVSPAGAQGLTQDRKSTRLNSSHGYISYAVFCLKKKKKRPHNLLSPHQQICDHA